MFSAYTRQRAVAFAGGLGGAGLLIYTQQHMTREVAAVSAVERARVREALPDLAPLPEEPQVPMEDAAAQAAGRLASAAIDISKQAAEALSSLRR